MPSKCPVMLKFSLKIMRISCISALTTTFGELSNGQEAIELLIRCLYLCFQSLNHSRVYYHSQTSSNHYIHNARHVREPHSSIAEVLYTHMCTTRAQVLRFFPLNPPVILSLCLVRALSNYSGNYAGIITSLLHIYAFIACHLYHSYTIVAHVG